MASKASVFLIWKAENFLVLHRARKSGKKRIAFDLTVTTVVGAAMKPSTTVAMNEKSSGEKVEAESLSESLTNKTWHVEFPLDKAERNSMIDSCRFIERRTRKSSFRMGKVNFATTRQRSFVILAWKPEW